MLIYLFIYTDKYTYDFCSPNGLQLFYEVSKMYPPTKKKNNHNKYVSTQKMSLLFHQ